MGREALDAAAGIVATRAALAAAAIAVIVFLPAFLAALLDQLGRSLNNPCAAVLRTGAHAGRVGGGAAGAHQQRIDAAGPHTQYAGSPMQLDFGEVGDAKTFVVVDVVPGKPPRVERVPYEGGARLGDWAGTLPELEAAVKRIADAARRREAERQAVTEFRQQHEERFVQLKLRYRAIRDALETIAKSGLDIKEIDAVVKTGGSSNIPLFTGMLARLFGAEKVKASNAFSSVVAGLAIKANT